MLQKMTNFTRQSGISLLELMLSLAIIAVILTMATRFYNQASQNQNLNNAVSMVNGIVAGVHTYRLNVGVDDTHKDPSIAALVTAHQLPQEFNGTNPWGGSMEIDWKATPPQVVFQGLPKDDTEGGACKSLMTRLLQAYPGTTCSSGTLSVPFTP